MLYHPIYRYVVKLVLFSPPYALRMSFNWYPRSHLVRLPRRSFPACIPPPHYRSVIQNGPARLCESISVNVQALEPPLTLKDAIVACQNVRRVPFLHHLQALGRQQETNLELFVQTIPPSSTTPSMLRLGPTRDPAHCSSSWMLQRRNRGSLHTTVGRV